MAAPTLTVRNTPNGFKMPEGFRTTFCFASKPNIQFWEKGIKPIGYDNGEPLKTTTQHNNRYHTKMPRQLIEVKDMTMKVMYDPDCLDDILAICGVNQACSHYLPDGTSIAFWGYLKSFDPDDLEEGKEPMATIGVVVTNWDSTNNTENGPVVTEDSGT